MDDFVIFSGNSNPELAQKICDYLDVPLGGEKVKDSVTERFRSKSTKM